MANTATLEKSAGHLAFIGDFEYFARSGEVFRAPHYACIMTDGCRCGRWECSVAHADANGLLDRMRSLHTA